MNLKTKFDLLADKLEKATLGSNYKAHKIIPRELLKLINKDALILDLGVGTGLSSRLFIDKKFSVVGMDFSKELLKVVSKYNYEQLIKQDLNKKLKVKKNNFDLVISFGVFDFFEDLNHIFNEVKRVLNINGYFAFTVIKSQKPSDSSQTYKHTKKEVRALVKKYNYKIVNELEFLEYEKKDYMAIYYGFILKKNCN
ncbi:class I SAM-dependent methyltransferase [Candidatus Woesearchaeota archaeon]|jgi:predicted TPR repeat methyltransferase|nr:class I SAM-dependent methyltransferase [Candidatus Woesearchaeota archaeon]MBT4387960.1 class I SAM-dependent methyltransferase [Candidatus Woesearchaeota archaeon]MBT4595304.1 class I SAM-dependent methyltransferase [Candidatus Woesearchaeota archaeon]MBT5741498.1 class I SAM-dependent methyltransferase [Candidatus Woesearchaeota archaeon]MBT6505640.1 class I SAM-dependent methyltransferase [Candidatus Woesearchaeota archaeon]